MSAVATRFAADFNPRRAAWQKLASFFTAFGVFLSGFVISEPAPYELMMVGLIAVFFLSGLKISRTVGVLLAAFLLFNTSGYLSLTQMQDISKGPIYMAVSTFLALSSVFYAAVIEDRAQRLKPMFHGWVVSALITATLGILGYFHAFPGSEQFTLYDRAKGAFQDPNVFGPFLVAPALYLIHGLLTGRLGLMLPRIGALLVIALGIFLSFSRAAWILFLFSAVMLVFIMLLKQRGTAFRLKITTLALVAAMLMAGGLGVALQFRQVSDLFLNRTKLVQDYDGGHLGRFERHRIGFRMSMERPFGLGPLVFGQTFDEDEHNIWLKTLTTYGWIGFATFIILLLTSLLMGFRLLLRDRPWQPYLAIAWSVVLGHVIIGNVIDIDHWRHFYLLLGIIWGSIALENRWQRQQRQRLDVA
nr:O-antigen ligase family protein [uncultured Gellertiella sp.]